MTISGTSTTTTPSTTGRRYSWLIAVAVTLVVAAYCWTRLGRGWVPHDEGTIAQSAERVLQHQVPHHDFIDVYTGGLSYLNAMALQAFGFEAMHASAVAEDRGVVVFAARSGTGKSTIAFGLSRRGYRQWSDDAVVFHSSSDGPIAAPLPFTVRLRPPSAALVGTAAAHMTPPDRLPARILAVCVLSRMDHVDSNRAAIIRRLDPSVAFRALLTHAHEFDPANLERRRRTLEAYLDLAASVPTYDVMFRHGRDAFEPLLDQIVDAVGLPADRAYEPIGA